MALGRDDNKSERAFDGSNASLGEPGVPRFARREALGLDEAAAEEERLERQIINDPSHIAFGHRQLNAAAFSGNRVDPKIASQQAEEKKRKADETLSREMQRLAEWNAQMVTIGGVRMTNGEAQRARRYLIENEDAVAKRAVRDGLMRPDQEERFKHEVRREYELNDRIGRGTDTAEDREELDRLNRSTLKSARDRMIGDTHQKLSLNATREGWPVDEPALFASAADLQGRFASAHKGPASQPEPAPVAAPVPEAPARTRAAATGLDI